ncbi:tyrosine-type recombinase/integrase [Rummeliibacillus pycnus]
MDKYILGFDIHPHTLRHTYASILISNGVDVVTVANLLGSLLKGF